MKYIKRIDEALSFHDILRRKIKDMSSDEYANFAQEVIQDPDDANEMEEWIEDIESQLDDENSG